MPNSKDESRFMHLSRPPERISDWATEASMEWRRADEFDILVKAEEYTGLRLEIKYFDMPDGVWGLHVVRGERGRICVNSRLPQICRRFAIFHEIYHFLHDTKGERFWSRTFVNMDSIENRADMFAWACIWPEYSEGDYAGLDESAM